MSEVTIVDYGLGNLHSVAKAMEHEGGIVTVTSELEQVRRAKRLVLPGVGAFSEGIAGLRARGLDEALREHVADDRPLLAICLGMQMLFSESSEFGRHLGLGLIPGTVVPIPAEAGRKIPHMGWSQVFPSHPGVYEQTFLSGVPPGARLYFAHSFTAIPAAEGHRIAEADYLGFRVTAAVSKGAIWGCQFHPEKSGALGLAILKRFLESA